MKAKDLIKILEKYPDFEIKTAIVHRTYDDGDCLLNLRQYEATGIDGIGLHMGIVYINFEEERDE